MHGKYLLTYTKLNLLKVTQFDINKYNKHHTYKEINGIKEIATYIEKTTHCGEIRRISWKTNPAPSRRVALDASSLEFLFSDEPDLSSKKLSKVREKLKHIN